MEKCTETNSRVNEQGEAKDESQRDPTLDCRGEHNLNSWRKWEKISERMKTESNLVPENELKVANKMQWGTHQGKGVMKTSEDKPDLLNSWRK